MIIFLICLRPTGRRVRSYIGLGSALPNISSFMKPPPPMRASPFVPTIKWNTEQMHDDVLFLANTGLRPDEARNL